MPGRIKANLQYCAEMIPTLSTQLRIIASVKASTPDDISVSDNCNTAIAISLLWQLNHVTESDQWEQYTINIVLALYIVTVEVYSCVDETDMLLQNTRQQYYRN